MKKEKLNALIQLLDDPDHTVFKVVEKELLNENHAIIPMLEKKWENSIDELCQQRIENLIQNLQFKQSKELLANWLLSKNQDLLEGILVIDHFLYPDLNVMLIQHKLEKIKKQIWLELSDSLTLLEKTTILNHFLFNVNGFSINHKNIHSPQNCFLNQVIDIKKGNPVSLSILYTLIARMLEIPVRFIDFPKNPLIAIVDKKLARKVHGNLIDSEVLFYINPSNKGSVTSRKEIEYHLRKNEYLPLHEYTEPKSDKLFIKRLVESLKESYQLLGFSEKEEKVDELLKLF